MRHLAGQQIEGVQPRKALLKLIHSHLPLAEPTVTMLHRLSLASRQATYLQQCRAGGVMQRRGQADDERRHTFREKEGNAEQFLFALEAQR